MKDITCLAWQSLGRGCLEEVAHIPKPDSPGTVWPSRCSPWKRGHSFSGMAPQVLACY